MECPFSFAFLSLLSIPCFGLQPNLQTTLPLLVILYLLMHLPHNSQYIHDFTTLLLHEIIDCQSVTWLQKAVISELVIVCFAD